MSAGAERNILTPEGSQFAVAKARLNRDKKQRSVPAANPCSWIRGCHEGCGLFLSEKLARSMLTAFRRNGKNALALKTQCQLADCDEPEEGMHCGQAGVACPHGVASALFKVSKEFLHEGRVELFHQQF